MTLAMGDGLCGLIVFMDGWMDGWMDVLMV
jgi:hypothetical protein